MLCDVIVRSRDVPRALLDRLAVVTPFERALQRGDLRGAARPINMDDVPSTPRDTREDVTPARERDGC